MDSAQLGGQGGQGLAETIAAIARIQDEKSKLPRLI
jgi:hypothetical protein